MTFEYVTPNQTTVNRTFTHDEMARDLYDILISGEVVATVDFKTARGYWIGRIKLEDIIANAKAKRRSAE